jgi:peptide/nickel transport system substrate-binding protein
MGNDGRFERDDFAVERVLKRYAVSRRDFVRLTAVGASALGIAPILAACADDSADDDAPDVADTDDTDDAVDVADDDTDSVDDDDDAADAPAPDGRGGSVIIGRSGDSDSLDPHHTIAAISWQVFSQIYDTLISYNMDLEFDPILASDYEVSDDGLEYTFYLREGIEFHDGSEFNADAVKFTFDRVRDPETNAPAAPWVESLESTEVVDDYTVRFHQAEAFAPFLGNIAVAYFGILPPGAVEERGDDFGQNPVGTGPFKFQEWVTGERITLVRNENYQNFNSYDENDGAPYLEELVYRNIPEEQTQIAALETGEINFMLIPPQQVDRFEGDENYQLHPAQQPTNIQFLEFSIDDDGFLPPFDDINVRQAVGYAVNAEEIIERVLNGLAIRNHGPMPVGNFGYTEDIAEHGFDFDQDRAAELLEEAGWEMGPNGVREKDGQPLEVLFWTWNATTQERVAQVIQNQLEAVGFQVRLETMEVATLLARLPDNEPQMDLMGWGWPESDILYMMTDTESGIGRYTEVRPEYREIVADARRATELDERGELYFEAMQMMLEDAAMIPLWTNQTVVGHRAELQGFKLGPQDFWAFLDAYVED